MAIFVEKNIFDKTLQNPPKVGKNLLDPLKSFFEDTGFPVRILEDSEVINDAEIHEHEGDLWQCLEGEATFVCGGKLNGLRQSEKNPSEWKGSGIEGGEEYFLKPGDWLWIPPGEPHLHKAEGTARLLVIKIPSDYKSNK